MLPILTESSVRKRYALMPAAVFYSYIQSATNWSSEILDLENSTYIMVYFGKDLRDRNGKG